MLIIKNISVDGTEYPVTISDDSMALQAAYAAGGAIIGIWNEQAGEAQTDFSACLYLVTSPEDADEKILERVVRRRLQMPWRIGETKRLLIREFGDFDPLEPEEWTLPQEAVGGAEEAYLAQLAFGSAQNRAAYIKNQYRLFECGLWALVEKESGKLVGKAGITDGELGYHIYPPFRGKGYAMEACGEIIRYGKEELLLKELTLRVKKDNEVSGELASRLGFSFCGEEENVRVFLKKLRLA